MSTKLKAIHLLNRGVPLYIAKIQEIALKHAASPKALVASISSAKSDSIQILRVRSWPVAVGDDGQLPARSGQQ